MKNTNLILMSGLILAALFFSCNSEKKIAQHYQIYKGTHRDVYAGDCGNDFPPQPKFISGTPVITHDTITLPGIMIDCPDGSQIKCPDCPKAIHTTKEVHDTAYLPNPAREEQLRLYADRMASERNQAEYDKGIVEKDRDAAKALATKRLYWIIGLLALIAIYIVLKIKKAIPF